MLRLGYTEVDITPYGSVEMVGFNRKDNISHGILKSLIAQVLSLIEIIENSKNP